MFHELTPLEYQKAGERFLAPLEMTQTHGIVISNEVRDLSSVLFRRSARSTRSSERLGHFLFLRELRVLRGEFFP